MSGPSSIEWTEHTWNPVRGCSIISPGCKNCYAMRDMARKNSNPKVPGCHGFAMFNDRREPHWTGKVELIPEMLDAPLKRKKPTMYFVNSMSDLFHEKLSFDDILYIFLIMQNAPWHTFQVLTKRANLLREFFVWERASRLRRVLKELEWPLPNVWLGVSVEDQQRADERIPELLKTPAVVRFLSVEPLLGPVDLFSYLPCSHEPGGCIPCRDFEVESGIDWVIVGGESGPGARPLRTEWVQSIVDQCRAAQVRCFVKQLGSHVIQGGERRRKKDKKGGDMHEWPHEMRVRQMPEVRSCS